MPEVPDPLPAPKSLGGLLSHIPDESPDSSDGFTALADRAGELTEDINQRREIVSEFLATEGVEKEVESDIEADSEA